MSIWYVEDGFQTVAPPEKRRYYHGRENDLNAVPALDTHGEAGAVDQATQLRDAILLAYCQPAVGAFFNFELVGRAPSLRLAVGCALGRLDAQTVVRDVREAINDVLTQQIDCSRFPPR